MATWRHRWLPPPTLGSVLRHYIPLTGAMSHSLFSMHIFAPTIVSRCFPMYDLAVSNTILFNAHLGLGFYIFFRRHLSRQSPWTRVQFSVFTSVMFNFGSLLSCVLLKALVPSRTRAWLRALFGVSISAFLLSRGHAYLTFLDATCSAGNAASNGEIRPVK